MKPKIRVNIWSLVSSGVAISFFPSNLWAEQASAAPSAVTSSAPDASSAPAPSSSPVAPSAPAAPSAPVGSVGSSSPPSPGAAPGSEAASVPASPTAAPLTDAQASDVGPLRLAPISEDALTKKKEKKKKKGKGKGARRAPTFSESGLNEADESWGDPWGDSQDELRAAGLSFRFLLQAHYAQTFAFKSRNADESYRTAEEILVRNGDGWDLNRLFFRMAAEPSRNLSLKIITDFAEFAHKSGNNAVKQAFVDIKPLPKHLHFLVGVLKLPFSITELDPITKYEFTKMPLANDLVKSLDFAGRDYGAEIMITPLSKARYLRAVFGAYRGHAQNENGSIVGSLGARVETQPIKGLRFGADWVEQPKTVVYTNPFDTSSKALMPNPENPAYPYATKWAHGQAFSGDITLSYQGLMLRTEAMYGTRVDYYTRYGAQDFAAIWGIAAYRFPVGSLQLQPAIRVEYLDTDTQHSVGLQREFAAGLATYFSPQLRLLVDVARTLVQDNSPVVDQPTPLRLVPYDALSNTRAAVQIQVVL